MKKTIFKITKKRVLIIVSILLAIAEIGVMLFCLAPAVEAYKSYNCKSFTELYGNIDLGDADKLMIVAHPDDDTIWGGAHLAEGGYFVVCITNGRNKKRHAEFDSVMDKLGCKHAILDYPDKVNGNRDDWHAVRSNIRKDIDYIISMRDWKLIVTHNPEGEYGHIHHIMTSGLVTDSFHSLTTNAELYYFGKYYSKDAILNAPVLTPVDGTLLEMKRSALQLYKSQASTVKKLSHMEPYEMWLHEADWKTTNSK